MNRFTKNAAAAAACWTLAALPGLLSAPAVAADNAPYKVVEGNKVDAQTLSGWRTWRAMACERCHGAAQEGMVGPSLVDSLKVLSKDEFKAAVLKGRIEKGMPNFDTSKMVSENIDSLYAYLKGRIEKGMPNFDTSKMVSENIDSLYAYLKGRSDGAIQPGRLQEMNK